MAVAITAFVGATPAGLAPLPGTAGDDGAFVGVSAGFAAALSAGFSCGAAGGFCAGEGLVSCASVTPAARLRIARVILIFIVHITVGG